jgi:regulator of PEP synthase PpsR (kinase-PPPase family)
MSDFGLEEAQVILVGVSRCGKTPTSLYMAMQFGIKAANYPLIPEDLQRNALPEILNNYPEKLYGLSISPQRLHVVRSERRPDSHYASLENCRNEIRMAESLMQRFNIPWIDSTSRSIEELSSTILQQIRAPA